MEMDRSLMAKLTPGGKMSGRRMTGDGCHVQIQAFEGKRGPADLSNVQIIGVHEMSWLPIRLCNCWTCITNGGRKIHKRGRVEREKKPTFVLGGVR